MEQCYPRESTSFSSSSLPPLASSMSTAFAPVPNPKFGRRPPPNLPPHILERHRRILAGILHKRIVIEEWRKEVGEEEPSTSSRGPGPRPTYQSRLREQFLELRDALPSRLRPGAAARVAIMETAMDYILDLKNSQRYLLGNGDAARRPDYIQHQTQNVSAAQMRTHRENCTVRMLSEVLPGLTGTESKIQLLEHAAETIRKLEIEYHRLLDDQRLEQAYSCGSSDFSGPPTTRDRTPMDAGAYSTSSRTHGRDVDRLPSIHDILRDKSPLDDLQLELPPLRMYQ